MWSPAINLFNPYYATLKSICKEQQDTKQEKEKKSNQNKTTPVA